MIPDMTRPQQLTFSLPVAENRSRGDFFVAPSNALALRMIENWRDWPSGRLLLTGPEGAGKSHLADIWQAESGAEALVPEALAGTDIPALAARPVLIDDADRLAGDRALEEALFHLHNALAARGQALLLTARTPPRDWPLALPDLASRLASMPACRLEAPDEALLAAVLVKLLADRQLVAPPSVIAYLTQRMERSLAAAARIVAEMDRIALAEKREIGRRLAARVLEALDKDREPGA